MTKTIKKGKCPGCGAKFFIQFLGPDAPAALRPPEGLRTVETETEDVIMGIPMCKPPCPKCREWLHGGN